MLCYNAKPWQGETRKSFVLLEKEKYGLGPGITKEKPNGGPPKNFVVVAGTAREEQCRKSTRAGSTMSTYT